MFKNHPPAYVEVYKDGRASAIFPTPARKLRHAFAFGFIEYFASLIERKDGEELEPGLYQITVRKLNMFRNSRSEFNLEFIK